MDKLEQMADAVAVALSGVVVRALRPLRERLEALEARQAERGEKGEAGPAGKDAEPVDVGAIVKSVLERVPEAAPGRDGRDGAPGPMGARGEDGRNGKDGVVTMDDFALQIDGRDLAVIIKCGEETIKRHVKIAGVPLYRGMYKFGDTYDNGDMITHGGSLWHNREDGNKAGPPGNGWSLVAKRGKDAS